MTCTDRSIMKEVSIPYSLYQSQKGEYFIGETPILSGLNGQALVALLNPKHSNSNIYLNAITVTNLSANNLSAEIYVRSSIIGGNISEDFSCVNLGISPEPIPNGEIVYWPTTSSAPQDGVSLFTRIVAPYSTLVIDGSQIIVSPGKAVSIYLGGLIPVTTNSTIVALGWWEERIYKGSNCY